MSPSTWKSPPTHIIETTLYYTVHCKGLVKGERVSTAVCAISWWVGEVSHCDRHISPRKWQSLKVEGENELLNKWVFKVIRV